MSTKTKVAFFAEILISDFDGASRTMFQLIDRIPNDQFDFLFICGTGPDQIQGFPCLKMPTVRIPGNETYSMSVPALAKSKVKKQLQAFAPDVIHIATPSLLGNFGLAYAKAEKLPVLTIYHTHFISYIAYYLRSAKFLINPVTTYISKKQRDFYNQCDLIYIPSASMGNALRQIGVESSKMKFWKRGIDRRLFSPEKADPEEHLQTLFSKKGPIILYASRLVWEKNLQVLIDVYKLASDQNLGYNFLIVGDGVARESCEQQMPNAKFLGHQDHEALARIYASSTVFLFPSTTETFGNVVLEALASGLPCVVSDEGGSQEFIQDGTNGFRSRSDSASDFLQHIQRIVDNSALALEMKSNAVLLSSEYDWDTLADDYFQDLKLLSEAAIKD